MTYFQGVTVYNALQQSNTHSGDWVVIPGAGGGLGHLGMLRSLSYTPLSYFFASTSHPICRRNGPTRRRHRHRRRQG